MSLRLAFSLALSTFDLGIFGGVTPLYLVVLALFIGDAFCDCCLNDVGFWVEVWMAKPFEVLLDLLFRDVSFGFFATAFMVPGGLAWIYLLSF